MNNGSFFGNATTAIDAERGEVLSLDGDHDHVQINGTFGDPANVTLAAWVRYNATDTWGGDVISLGVDVAIRVDDVSDGVMGYFWDGSAHQRVSTNISLADGQWHHLAFTFDDASNTQTLYIDGLVAASANFSASIGYTGWFPYTRIGDHPNDAEHAFSFNGLIDDARVYTRALSAEEVAALAMDESETSGSTSLQVDAVNDPPAFTGLNGTPSFTLPASLRLKSVRPS